MAPYDGAGNFALPPGGAVDGTVADAADVTVPFDDIEAALSQVLLRSGVAPMTGDLNMGGHSINNVGGGSGFLTPADTGTSGHKIPYLDIANAWSAVQNLNAGAVVGNEVADPVTIKGTVATSYGVALLGTSNAAAARTYIGAAALAGGNTWTGSQSFNDGGVLGDAAADPVTIKGTAVSAAMAFLLGAADAATARGLLGLGTAATYNVGTSGTTVPLLNTLNTWVRTQTFSNATDTYAAMFGVSLVGQVPVQVAYSFPSNTAGYLIQFADISGQCGAITVNTFSHATTYATSSDYRLKENIRDLDDVGAMFDALRPRMFNWKSYPGHDYGGFIAHELYQVVPEAVVGDKDAVEEDGRIKPQGVDLSKMIPYLVAEIKALRARVAVLEAADQ